MVLIFMGVSGSGKTTVARLFTEKTGAVFYEGDDYHPPENVAKMRAGIPLTDTDRAPWLQTLRTIIVDSLARKELAALACSALRTSYRDVLAAGDPRVRFVHLTGPKSLIEERLKNRPGHFMPVSLLASQLATLEPPTDALVFGADKSPPEIVDELLHVLGIQIVA